jgi:6,7-dimethyl-8-ribityllumazine synthase
MNKGLKHASAAFDTPELEGVMHPEGSPDRGAFSIALVVSLFNTELTDALLVSAVTCLKQKRVKPEKMMVVHVPGAFEIPTVAEQLAKTGDYHAIIALGVVLQGETPHAGIINAEVARALCDIARRYGVPVIDGVVAAGTMEQAAARALTGEHSRGWYAAEAAVEMAEVMALLKK